MNANAIWRALAVLGVIVLSVTVAHAGHGNGGGQINGWRCYAINGATPDRVVTLTDALGTSQTLRLGAASLFCSMAGAVKFPNTQDTPDFDLIPSGADIKCYNITGTVPGPKPVVRVVDPINGGLASTDGETVTASASKFFCTQADGFEQ
jgi:hypothetical protein